MDYLKGNPSINRGLSGRAHAHTHTHTHTHICMYGEKIKKKECGRVRIFNGDDINFFRI